MILSKEEVWVLRGIDFRLAFTEESVDATGPNRRRIPLRHRFSDSDGMSGRDRERERVEEKIARGLVSLHGDSQVIEVNRFSLLLRRNYGRFLGEEAEEELAGVSDEVKSFRVDFVDYVSLSGNLSHIRKKRFLKERGIEEDDYGVLIKKILGDVKKYLLVKILRNNRDETQLKLVDGFLWMNVCEYSMDE
ncbi:hypothetical protein YC2023_084337 [Brassica napus]